MLLVMANESVGSCTPLSNVRVNVPPFYWLRYKQALCCKSDETEARLNCYMHVCITAHLFYLISSLCAIFRLHSAFVSLYK